MTLNGLSIWQILNKGLEQKEIKARFGECKSFALILNDLGSININLIFF
jgi:hypothetical protein